MTQDKDLLIKDLCARLPYGVKIEIINCGYIERLLSIDTYYDSILINNEYHIEEIKPYLFPMSSMTEEQYMLLRASVLNKKADHMIEELEIDIKHYKLDRYAKADLIVFDWLNEHHFDFHNLIERGLAIDCTNLNIY